jgi:serine O-acetyltransferase
MAFRNRSEPGEPRRREGELMDGSAGIEPACRAPVTVGVTCVRAVRREINKLLRVERPRRVQLELFEWRLDDVAAMAAEDLAALTSRDPASLGSWNYVLDSYSAFRAVLAHRLAHAIHRQALTSPATTAHSLLTLARRISEGAKVDTGVEIHPAASIGRRFVLDHAIGTVIGETTVMGDDCYVLQGVILGATGIAANRVGKRHPTLGHRVQLGAFARVLGPVRIGADVFIGPGAVVTTDVPDGARVRLMNQCQVLRPVGRSMIFGVVPVGPAEVQIHGTGLGAMRIEFVAGRSGEAKPPHIDVLHASPSTLTCRITGEGGPTDESLRLTEPMGAELRVTQLEPVWRHMRSLGAPVKETP